MCERLVKASQRISRRTAATSFYMRITRPTWSPSIRTARMQHGIMPCKGEIIERSQLKLFQSKCVCSSCLSCTVLSAKQLQEHPSPRHLLLAWRHVVLQCGTLATLPGRICTYRCPPTRA